MSSSDSDGVAEIQHLIEGWQLSTPRCNCTIINDSTNHSECVKNRIWLENFQSINNHLPKSLNLTT